LELINSNLNSENENLISNLEKVTHDKKYISKLKEDNEEVEEKKNRELNQLYQISLSKILHNISKIKSKYQTEIIKIKNEVENSNIIFDSNFNLN
jgi:hypothetical protein